MRLVISGLAAAVAVVAAPAMAAQTVTIISAGVYNPGYVNATVNGVTTAELAGPLTFQASSVKTGVFDALGFCVDLPHPIYVGLGYQYVNPVKFHVAPLTSDGYGNPLSSLQIREITGLARLGFTIAKGGDADKATQLAAIQQAIWTVEYPASTFAATGPVGVAQAGYAAIFVSEAPRLSGFVRFLTSDSGSIQAQGTNIGGVPEPMVWVEMLVGFAVVGSLGRARRGTMTTVNA